MHWFNQGGSANGRDNEQHCVIQWSVCFAYPISDTVPSSWRQHRLFGGGIHLRLRSGRVLEEVKRGQLHLQPSIDCAIRTKGISCNPTAAVGCGYLFDCLVDGRPTPGQ